MSERDTFVAFVRAVMIGREGLHRPVLLDMFERAGAGDPVSYITTGNVSFEATSDELSGIVDAVETDLESLLERPTPLFVRTLDELRSLLDADPFAASPFPEPDTREISFVADRVPDHVAFPIESTRGDWSVFAASEREIFAVQRKIDGKRQSPGGRIERLVGEPITSRAIGTIERIVTKLSA